MQEVHSIPSMHVLVHKIHLIITKIFGEEQKYSACHQTTSLSHTESQNLNVSRLVLQLSLPNPLKPGVKLRIKLKFEQHREVMLQLHLSDQQFIAQ